MVELALEEEVEAEGWKDERCEEEVERLRAEAPLLLLLLLCKNFLKEFLSSFFLLLAYQ